MKISPFILSLTGTILFLVGFVMIMLCFTEIHGVSAEAYKYVDEKIDQPNKELHIINALLANITKASIKDPVNKGYTFKINSDLLVKPSKDAVRLDDLS
jgi:hypothetical protein